jgi:hypothetical protein
MRFALPTTFFCEHGRVAEEKSMYSNSHPPKQQVMNDFGIDACLVSFTPATLLVIPNPVRGVLPLKLTSEAVACSYTQSTQDSEGEQRLPKCEN